MTVSMMDLKVKRERHFGLSTAGPLALAWQSIVEAFSRFMRHPQRRLPSSSLVSHLDESQLLAYLDGELSNSARNQAADHMQSCWSCRGRFRDLCGTVKAYVVRREVELPNSASESDDRVRQMRRRLVGSGPITPRS